MTEITESVVLSSLTNTENNNQNQKIKWINNNYPIRCPQCSNICLIDDIDVKETKFSIVCDNQHKNVFNSFETFKNDVMKDINRILCNKCKCYNPSNINNMERCNNCFLIFCKKCISEHEKTENYFNKIELNKIDNFCYKHKKRNEYFSIENKYHICQECYDGLTKERFIIDDDDYIKIEDCFPNINMINKEYKDIEKLIKNYQTLIQSINEWKNELFEKIKKIDNFLNYYYFLKKSIIEHLNNKENYNQYNNNLYVLLNYEILTKLKSIERYVNIKNKEIQDYKGKNFNLKSKKFLEAISDFPIICSGINSKSINNLIREKNKIVIEMEEEEKEKSQIKFSDMKLNKYKFENKIRCFNMIKDKYIILGLDIGDVSIYELTKKKDEYIIIKRLDIKEFKKPIKFICQIDNNIIAISDKSSNIKIIELNENLVNYSIIQEIEPNKENSIYSMIYLPNLSYYKNRHHFCIANDYYIFFYKSNKQPNNLMSFKENYHGSIQEISLVQPTFIQGVNIISKEYNQNNNNNESNSNKPLNFDLIETVQLNTLAHSLIEINEKYIVAACTNANSIKFFDVNNKFEEKKNINNINTCGGSYIMSLVDNGEVLIVGTTIGFCFISTKTLEILKKYYNDMKIISLGIIYNNTVICCAISNTNEKKILQVEYLPEKTHIKINDSNYKAEDEVWDLKCFNNIIYFISNSDFNIFQK